MQVPFRSDPMESEIYTITRKGLSMNTRKFTNLLVLNCCVWMCLSVSNTFAQTNGDEGQNSRDSEKRKGPSFVHRERLQGYEENYAVWQWKENDEDSLRAHFSIRYLLLEPKDDIPRSEFFLSYTGEFDFYAGTRASDPVINRINNPGIHFRRYLGGIKTLPNHPLEYLELGFEHQSNGQTVDADDRVAGPGSQFVAQAKFLSNDHEFFDGISRSSNFFSFNGRLRIERTDNNNSSNRKPRLTDFLIDFSLKPLYVSSDSNVTWGPLANNNIEFSDYDRFSIALTQETSYKLGPLHDPEMSVKWTLGDKGKATDSIDLSLSLPIYLTNEFLIPSYVRYHNGPMSTLSDYTKNQPSISVGFNLNI